MKSRTRRAAVMSPVLAATALLLLAPPATADARGTVKTNGIALKVRSGPGTRHPIVGRIPNGSKVTITCQTTGDTVKGTFGTSNIWDRLSTGGYVSDTYVHTGSDGRVAPPCGGGARLVDDYPYKNDSYHQADPWNFYKRECVSFVAWRLRQRHGVPFHNHYKGVRWSNADRWDEVARRVGIRVDKLPAVGAIAQWNNGRFGHVAYVARVSGGKVTVEEYNKGGTHRYGTRTIGAGAVENYIHIAR